MKKIFFAMTFLSLTGFAQSFTRTVVNQCTIQDVGGFAIQTLKAHVVKTLANGGSKIDPSKFQVKYLGLRPVFDTTQIARPQHAFSLSLIAEDNTPIAFATPTEALEGAKINYVLNYNGLVVGLPQPEIVFTRDALGNVIARNCVVKSHAGVNRHFAYVNSKNGYIFNIDFISFELPVLVNVPMK